VLRELLNDRLFSSFVRSEQEIQIKEIIRKNMDHIKSFQEIRAQDLSKDEIDELANTVKRYRDVKNSEQLKRKKKTLPLVNSYEKNRIFISVFLLRFKK
jgi:hypothetical protein